MLLTDPPYNVWYTGKTGDALTIDNDSWSDDGEFVGFLEKAFSAALGSMRDGAAFYIWHAMMETDRFIEAAERAGMEIRQTLVWVKNAFAFGRQDYQWRHEPCLYGWKDGAAHYFFDSRCESTVIEDARPNTAAMKKDELRALCDELMQEREASTVLRFDRPNANEEHPTMKPVRLFAYLVRNSSRRGEIVLDTFCGSGTTVMACEQLGRRCAAMELDPHYASVIVDRWERLTGKTAERVES